MIPFRLRPREYDQLAVLVDECHDARVVRRGHALLGLHEGLSASEIAELLNVSRQTIYNWAQVFQEREDLSLAQRELACPAQRSARNRFGNY